MKQSVMETSELRLILENYFTPQEMAEYIGSDTIGGHVYDEAIESILGEDSPGLQIMSELDEASAKQRQKIRSMSSREIRNSLSVEFLEPGKRLALILWALLRDDRLSARNHARNISETFAQQMEEPPSPPMDEDHQKDLIQEISDEINEDIDDESAAQEGIDIENASEDDVMEQILAELNSGAIEKEADIKETPETEQDLDLDFLEEENYEIEDEGEEDEDEDEEYDFSYELDLDTDEDENSELTEEEEPLHLPDKKTMNEGMEEVDRLIANLEESPEEESTTPSTPCVTISGVEISLHSLKRACERVFNETVELVTDENLTRQDKIVVIGKRCGLYVLQGPRYKIEPVKTTPLDVGESIDVSPISLQAALSRIHNENIEIVPDPSLLKEGIVVFAGKETGLSVMNNSVTSIPLPNWVNEDLKAEIESPTAPASSEINNLRQKISELEERLDALAKRPPVQPQPEPEDEDSEISQEVLSLEDIESEELEPIPEEIPEAVEHEEEEEDEDLHEEGIDESAIDSDLEEILGAVSDSDESTGEENINYEEMLKEFPEDESRQDEGESQTKEDETSEVEDEDDFSDIDIDDLDLEALTESEEETQETQESEEEDEKPGGEEDDLDGLMENIDMGEEEKEEGEEDDESGEEDFDLDVLGELEETEEEEGETKPIFNGEQILLLGGDQKHAQDYKNVVEKLGGQCKWRGEMEDTNDDEISEMVESADIIMTLSSEALSDPGILQATSYAQESNKRVFEHHSANPNSVQKKLTQLVEEGKV